MTDVYDAPENEVLEQESRGNEPSGTAAQRSGDDRRSKEDRRRSAQGLFEHRARREGIADDRRRQERREQRRRLLQHLNRFARLLGFSRKSSSQQR